MSCWVVPTVAAEYWGISLDIVLSRITDGLLPMMKDSGFVFVDVDPWTAACSGGFRHKPPPTFVMTAQEVSPVESSSVALLTASSDSDEDSSDELRSQSSEASDEQEEDQQLPELDEEETATFGRLSWEEVRQQVGRMRRPPSFQN